MATVNKPERKNRDNFSQAVLKILYRRAGGKCCKCGASTFGPVTNNPHQTVNIGKGAHIAAAAPGGPRYDKSMKSEERSSATNGMWMCSNCHDLIDRDPVAYPTKTLYEIKKSAEARVRKDLGVPTYQETKPFSTEAGLVTGISAAVIIEIRQMKARLMEASSSKEEGEEIIKNLNFLDFEEDEYKTEVGREMMLFLRQVIVLYKDPSILLEVLRRLQSVANCFSSQWSREQVELVCDIVVMVIKSSSSKRSKVYQSGVALLKDLSNHKAIKERKLHTVPLNAIKSLRAGRDEIDAPPAAKRPHQMEEEEEEEEVYLKLMEELVQTTDLDKVLQIEQKLQELGYDEPYVQ